MDGGAATEEGDEAVHAQGVAGAGGKVLEVLPVVWVDAVGNAGGLGLCLALLLEIGPYLFRVGLLAVAVGKLHSRHVELPPLLPEGPSLGAAVGIGHVLGQTGNLGGIVHQQHRAVCGKLWLHTLHQNQLVEVVPGPLAEGIAFRLVDSKSLGLFCQLAGLAAGGKGKACIAAEGLIHGEPLEGRPQVGEGVAVRTGGWWLGGQQLIEQVFGNGRRVKIAGPHGVVFQHSELRAVDAAC